jgi:hypothetical protein
MADLTNGSGVFQTYDNAGTGVAELGDNLTTLEGQGIAGRTVIVTVLGNDDTNVTQAELDGVVKGITFGETAGSPAQTDAFTVVGIDGTADGASGAVYLALQGTGTVQTTKGDYFTNTAVAVVADFEGLQ